MAVQVGKGGPALCAVLLLLVLEDAFVVDVVLLDVDKESVPHRIDDAVKVRPVRLEGLHNGPNLPAGFAHILEEEVLDALCRPRHLGEARGELAVEAADRIRKEARLHLVQGRNNRVVVVAGLEDNVAENAKGLRLGVGEVGGVKRDRELAFEAPPTHNLDEHRVHFDVEV